MVEIHVLKQICTVNDRIPTRFNVAVMLFMACFITYMLRVNLSINILAMVEPTKTDANGTVISAPNYGVRYNWSVAEQSILLGSYFWGYLFTSLPAGMLAEWFGGKLVVAYALILSAILTALMPIVAGFSFWIVFACRFLTGFVGGVLYPALHSLVSKWAPPDEKGKFIASLLGGAFGTVITWPLAGVLVEQFGWEYAFYVPAVITGFVTIVWCLIVSDSPSNHPRIKPEEKEYIESSLGDSISKKKSFPPFLSLLTSLPFWSLLILHYGNLWGLYFLSTAAPKYMNEVLGFNLAKAGLLAALPYLARMFAGFAFGQVGDSLRKKQKLSVTAIRKSFCVISHIIPGLFLICLSYIGHHPYLCVAIITCSLGFNGCSTITNLQNSQDLAPNYAGSLYGIINFIGTTTGFITPLVVAYFTQEGNTVNEWSIIFMIGAIVYILPALVFIFFGSGEIQPWNDNTKKMEDSIEATPSPPPPTANIRNTMTVY